MMNVKNQGSPTAHSFSAFLLGGVTSGCGKTTLTLGILAALKARGLAVQPFKCGPDFIDPSLHRMVTGRVSPNLDLRMAGVDFCRTRFIQGCAGQEVAVVEGVMGLFDGGAASSAELAKTLELPVVLVVDARSAAESVAAVVKGFEVYDPQVRLAGVIFNRVGSSRHAEMIRGAVEQACQARILGFFPRDIRFEIPDRHLGLHMGEESPLDPGQLAELVSAIERHLDLDALLELGARPASAELESNPPPPPAAPLKLAVARDPVFCFYYEDNLRLLEQAGFELLFFSPLRDQRLPEGLDALYLGGGYPELHAEELSANSAMRRAIVDWAWEGGVVYAECGGFMYLCDKLIDMAGQQHAMVGIFPAVVRMRPRLARLGYRRARLRASCLWGEAGELLHGHEFHYSEVEQMAPEVETLYQLEDGRTEGYRVGNVMGGYLHLHFGQTGKNVLSFYHHIREIREKRNSVSEEDGNTDFMKRQ